MKIMYSSENNSKFKNFEIINKRLLIKNIKITYNYYIVAIQSM